MFLIGFPLLLIPFVLYNMIAFLTPGVGWTDGIAAIPMMSGAEWILAPGDILIAIAVLLLFVEVLKSARMGARTVVDHLLSMILFITMIVEFVLVRQAATSTFFVLLVIGFVDVIGGYSIAIRAARRDIEVSTADKILS